MLSGNESALGSMLGPAQMDNSIGDSMFEMLGRKPNFGPSAEQMATAMQRVQTYRKVELKEVCVRTYDLSKPADLDQYQLDLEHIYRLLQVKQLLNSLLVHYLRFH